VVYGQAYPQHPALSGTYPYDAAPLHLLSDSTGETLEMIAKAALSQFEDTDVVRHFWPMVRSQAHLDRIIGDIAANPGLVVYTMVSQDIRKAWRIAVEPWACLRCLR
jgi:regulator of PEP synthase PpsR (kinase-PPPase family)